MNKLLYIFTLFLLLLSCDKETNEDINESSIEYSGVLVGSTGFYNIYLESGNSSATVVFDSITYNFTNTDIIDFSVGINNLVFANNGVSLTVSLPAGSSQPSFSFSIPNHTIEYTVFIVEPNITVNNYLGTSSSTSTTLDSNHNVISESYISSTYNLSIQNNNNFQIIEKITSSNNGGVGQTTTYSGGVNFIGTNIVEFTFIQNGQSNTITANVNGNIISNSITETFNGDFGQTTENNFSFNFTLQ
ncbi:MAG: hypothetical protein R2836_05860 [Chitinophagales bacterium]